MPYLVFLQTLPRGMALPSRPRPSVHMKNSRPTVKQKSWRTYMAYFGADPLHSRGWTDSPTAAESRIPIPRTDHVRPPPFVTMVKSRPRSLGGQEMVSSVCTHPDHPRPPSHLSSPCRRCCRRRRWPPSSLPRDLRSGGMRRRRRRRRRKRLKTAQLHPALRSERKRFIPSWIPRFGDSDHCRDAL